MLNPIHYSPHAHTGVPALVQSKGHIIDGVAEFPLVVSDETQKLTKTKQAVALLRRLRIWADVQKVKHFSCILYKQVADRILNIPFNAYLSSNVNYIHRIISGKMRDYIHYHSGVPFIIHNMVIRGRLIVHTHTHTLIQSFWAIFVDYFCARCAGNHAVAIT